MSEVIKKGIENVLSSLFQSIENESVEEFKQELKEVENFSTAEKIEFAKLKVLKFQTAIKKTLVNDNNKTTAYIADYIIDGNLEHYLEKVIKNNEGFSCSADKRRFILRKILLYIETGENQSLYANYEGIERIPKEEWNEQAYWSPKTWKDTDEVIRDFEKWYFMKELN